MTERILRKTVKHELIQRPATEAVFTTASKFRRRRRKYGISGNRARDFMAYLWRNDWRECKYEGLKIQFIQYFGTNEQRVVEKYLGRPKLTVDCGRERIARSRLTSGGVSLARFQYAHKRELAEKSGLMEFLGFITLDKKTGHVVLHHEKFPYYTTQTTLSPRPPLSEKNNERSIQIQTDSDVSKQDLCVCLIETEEKKKQHGKNLNGSLVETERREREI